MRAHSTWVILRGAHLRRLICDRGEIRYIPWVPSFEYFRDFRERRLGAKHFSANCEEGDDLILNHIFRYLDPRKNDLNYVEVGANDAFNESISYQLAKQGWQGISIDSNPIHEVSYISRAKFLRQKHTKFICAAIGIGKTQITTSHYHNSLLDTSNNLFKLRAKDDNNTIINEDVTTTIELNDILPSSLRHIQLLSINTRGSDFEILKSLDLNVFNVDVIRIEILHTSIGEITEHPTYKYLYDQGYRLIIKMSRLSFWIKPGSEAAKWIPAELLN